MMGAPFLSRHFLGEASTCATLIPFAPPGAADAEGVSSTHNLIGIGAWNEDAKVRTCPALGGMGIACRRGSGTQCGNALAAGCPPAAARPATRLPVQEYHLSVVDLAVAHCREEVARAPALTRLAAFEHPGRPGCIKAR